MSGGVSIKYNLSNVMKTFIIPSSSPSKSAWCWVCTSLSKRIRFLFCWILIFALLSITSFYVFNPSEARSDTLAFKRVSDISDNPIHLDLLIQTKTTKDFINAGKHRATPVHLNVDPINSENGDKIVPVLQKVQRFFKFN
jgi:hypothetical protein